MTGAGGRGDPRRPQARPALGPSTWIGLGLLVVLGVFLCLPDTPGVVRVFSLIAAALLARRVSIDVRAVREDKAAWGAGNRTTGPTGKGTQRKGGRR